jgi:aerobic-type carbon monoxide dehydrogenase small subunit (CoxS/CutS family)
LNFYLNDKPIRTIEAPASALLDFVRYHEQLKGTKIGCREGDCGACTVLVGELAADGQTVHYQSMTSCLTPLGNAQGKRIVTVEGINAAGSQLTPVQQAIVDEDGSQCGFCTVGFVMSLTGHNLSGQPATEKNTIVGPSTAIFAAARAIRAWSAPPPPSPPSWNSARRKMPWPGSARSSSCPATSPKSRPGWLVCGLLPRKLLKLLLP